MEFGIGGAQKGQPPSTTLGLSIVQSSKSTLSSLQEWTSSIGSGLRVSLVPNPDIENGWTKSRFSSRMNEILSQNFKSPSTVRGQLDFSSVIGETNPDRLRLIEEANYLKGIKDKLMDFASSRYAFTNAGFQSQGKQTETGFNFW